MSTHLGVPDMKDMVKDILIRLGKGDPAYLDILNEVSARLDNASLPVDIENILGALEASIEPEKVWREIGHKVAAVMSQGQPRSISSHEKIAGLIERMKQEIGEACQRIDPIRVMNLYGELFLALKEASHGSENGIPFLYTKVVTTNYDLSLEYYFKTTGIPFSEGFRMDEFNQVVFSSNWGHFIELVKIHGSISYAERNGVVERVDVPVGGNALFGPLPSRMMIYPAGEKSITKRPYFDLYSRFRQGLFNDNILVVMGSSLRDVAIRNIIEDWITAKRNSQLFLFGRSAEETSKTLPDTIIKHTFARNLEIPSEGWTNMIRDELRTQKR